MGATEPGLLPLTGLQRERKPGGGCGWQRILHMFQWPFYAIDYALAQVCALGYLPRMNEDRAGAWRSYLDFCRRTGTESFPELARKAGLDDPFGEGTLAELARWLETEAL